MKKHANRPNILVVNDDGITAPGIKNLIEVAQELGNVVVVAPDGPQSGMGHAITIGKPLRFDKVDLYPGVEMYKCSGTPVDCVKLAVNKIFKGQKPDLCVSGINHGLNNSINVIYSGTMSAAVEGAIESIPSIGFSLDDFSQEADFSHSKKFIKIICEQVLANGLPPATLLNVNFPKGADLKGIKICRQANAKWAEEFDERNDPYQRPYYWLTGVFQNFDKGEDTDVWALENNYVSVVPVQFDLTAHHAIPVLNTWNLMFKAFKDTLWAGLGIGLLVPGVLIGITWYIMHAVSYLAKLDLLLIGYIAVNALMLKFVFKENKDNIGRGLIIATFAWGMAFFYYKISKS